MASLGSLELALSNRAPLNRTSWLCQRVLLLLLLCSFHFWLDVMRRRLNEGRFFRRKRDQPTIFTSDFSLSLLVCLVRFLVPILLRSDLPEIRIAWQSRAVILKRNSRTPRPVLRWKKSFQKISCITHSQKWFSPVHIRDSRAYKLQKK